VYEAGGLGDSKEDKSKQTQMQSKRCSCKEGESIGKAEKATPIFLPGLWSIMTPSRLSTTTAGNTLTTFLEAGIHGQQAK